MIRFAYHDSIDPVAPLDAWRTMPQATMPRWQSMSELVSSMAQSFDGRLAMLGYPNPRAAVRVLAHSRSAKAAALVSPIAEYGDRTEALARRLRLGTTVLTMHKDPRDSRLRACYFDLVIGRVPIDDAMHPAKTSIIIADHLVEMLRIGTPRALLLLHLTVRTGLPDASQRAASLGLWVSELLHCAGVRRACLGSSVVQRATGTIDVVGWARRTGQR